MTNLNVHSVQSLYTEMRFQATLLASGTSFVVSSEAGPMLITNRHNVTGRRQADGQAISSTGGVPDRLIVGHTVKASAGISWRPTEHLLYDDGSPLWREHPTLGAAADFVALPISLPSDAEPNYYSLSAPVPDVQLSPADVVSVVGFPFGMTGGALLAIWATGFIASEPDVDFNEQPVFLIDCRSRPGQFGSPVIFFRNGGTVRTRDGNAMMLPGGFTNFLGIYSGRINDQSDLGIVWKRSALAELVASI